jgi:hypothetical protein
MPPTYCSGWIYVLENGHMPGLFKIGCTERTVEERVLELSNVTGVPSPFICVFRAFVRTPRIIERMIHEKLAQHKAGKEFFKVEFDQIVESVQNIVDDQNAGLGDVWRHAKYAAKPPKSEFHPRGDPLEGWNGGSTIGCQHCGRSCFLSNEQIKRVWRSRIFKCAKCGIASEIRRAS